MWFWKVTAVALFGMAALCLFSHCALAANYSESTNGDLSNDHTNPTPLALSVGTNVLTATTGLDGDLEYVRVDVPVGSRFASLVLQSYSNIDGASFIGMRTGNSIPTDACCTSAGDLDGYTLFGTSSGTGVANVGENILPGMGTASGAMGFTPPLSAGSYTFWIHQTSGVATSYQLDFNVELLPTDGTGDYNNDGIVNAADYVVWRSTDGTQTGYDTWRTNFGKFVGLGVNPAAGFTANAPVVPEPAGLVLLMLAVAGWILQRTWDA